MLLSTRVKERNDDGYRSTGLNVVNPAFEAFWHDPVTRANLHLVWSPLSTRSGAGGWETHHQIALFADRGIVIGGAITHVAIQS